MITGYDSTNLADIPSDAALVLYYLNGSWPASAGDLARFPNAIKEGISVTPFANVGKWLDVENGDAFPWQAPGWVVMRRNAGQSDAGVYVQYDMWAATRNEFTMRGIPEPNWWIALWDGRAVLLPGSVGKQYAADHPGTVYFSGGHYDKSVFNYVFGPGGGTIGGDLSQQAEQLIVDLHAAVARLEVAFGTALADGSGPAPPDQQPKYLGFVNNELRTGLAQIAEIKTALVNLQPGAAVDLTPVMQALAQLENKLATLTLKAT